MHIQIVLNILCQFLAHTLSIVTFTKHVNYMSIGFLVVMLLMVATKIDFTCSENRANRYNTHYIPLYHYIPISQYTIII